MKHNKKIAERKAYRRQLLSVIFMMFLLVFLTSFNYFLYPSCDKNSGTIAWQGNGEESQQDAPTSPAGPDEKSPNGPFSFNEEYVHENHHSIDSFWTNMFFGHKIHEAEKLCVVHFDLFCPPPLA